MFGYFTAFSIFKYNVLGQLMKDLEKNSPIDRLIKYGIPLMLARRIQVNLGKKLRTTRHSK